MTCKELSQLYYLNREIGQDRQRALELEGFATSATSRITGLPHVNFISDKNTIVADIADIRSGIDEKIKRNVAEYNRLMGFIAKVSDSRMRQIIAFRHIDDFNWKQIALFIGGGNTDKSVAQAYYRFLRSEAARQPTFAEDKF